MGSKIIIADDHQILRQGLKLLLEKQTKYKVIGEAANGREAVEKSFELEPDIVIMDINMPTIDGIDATRQIASKLPNTKVIALSMHQKKRYITEILKAGASGYILKDKAFSQLLTAIETVEKGQIYLCPNSSNIVLEDYVNHNKVILSAGQSQLTKDEYEMIKLIAEGKNSKEIAKIFGVNAKTIDARRRKTMKKLKIDNIPDLVKFAIREGISDLD